MKINTMNNDYNNQKQQNFGAIAGKNFEEGLVSLLTNLRSDVLQKTLVLLNDPKTVSEFVAEFRDIKIAKTGFHGVVSPVIDIFEKCGIYGTDVEVPATIDLGQNRLTNELQLQPGANLFNIILRRLNTAISGCKLCPRTEYEPPSNVTPTTKSIRQSVHDLVEMLNKDNFDTTVEIL